MQAKTPDGAGVAILLVGSLLCLHRTNSLYLAHLDTIKRIDPGNFGDYPHKA
ncbi:hypothetical protein SAMN04488511_11525 [Pedobacter suwonensis]|uniref:Uncharacterized protein n=1 Tax=Pedobacter suwonensis TaxID=332999 RepID=A0A1I0TV44_9SPHI|nr:hypothetical protein SAMN04488511_11525 [Pedobacter suwonensis]